MESCDINFDDATEVIEFAPYTIVRFEKRLELYRMCGYIRIHETGMELVKGETVMAYPSPPPFDENDYIF